MKILFYSINNMWVPHFETELELMLDHKERGDEIFVLTCSKILPRCTSNYEHVKTACLKCRSRFDVGMKLVAIPASNIFYLARSPLISRLPRQFVSLEELQNFTIDSIEFGRMVASTIISELRDHKFNTITYADKVYKNLCTAINVYTSAFQTLSKLKPDYIYIFNGRFSDVAPVVVVCRQLNIPFYTHERGGTMTTYSLFENTLPHDLAYNKKIMQQLWHNETDEDKKQNAAQWFIQRRAGVQQSWLSFITDQQKGLLPQNFDHNKINIAIFNSSFDEYIMFPEWQNPLYQDENAALADIFEYFKHHHDIHFYLRVHPNLRGYKRTQIEELKVLAARNYQNVTIIWPEETIDSYTLLEQCNKVIVFASTIGVEACFWGKPVVLIGRAFYEDLDSAYVAKTVQDARQLTAEKNLLPKNSNNALPYAFWELYRGVPFKRFKPDGLFRGTFLGKELKPQFGVKDKVLFRIYDRLERWRG